MAATKRVSFEEVIDNLEDEHIIKIVEERENEETVPLEQAVAEGWFA